MKPQMILRHKLKDLLQHRRMRPIDLARELGIAKQVISDWLAGSRSRNLEQIKQVANYFEITIDELCFESDGPQRPNPRPPGKIPEQITGIFEVNLRYLGGLMDAMNQSKQRERT